VAYRHPLASREFPIGAAGAVEDRVVAVTGLRVAQGYDQLGVGVDDDLQVRRVAVLALRGEAVVAGRDQGAVDDRKLAFGRRRAGARASSGPRVQMTRRAAECETPNSAPILSTVRFVRQYTATSGTRSGSASGRPGRPVGDRVTATPGDQPYEAVELARA
jgi:hypothetical protein